jgi:hypothetical protein
MLAHAHDALESSRTLCILLRRLDPRYAVT